MKNKCEARINECYLLAEKRLGRKFKRIPITYSNRMTKTAGCFKFDAEGSIGITYSNKLLELNGMDFIDSTIGHEIAHHIVYEVYGKVQPHGKEWKRVMCVLGQEPKVRHNLKEESFKYVIEGETYLLTKIQHGKCQKGARYRNKKTGAKIIAKYWVKG